VAYGYGRRYDTLDVNTRVTARKWFYGAQIMYKFALTLIKIAVACLYYRIFAVSSDRLRIACHAFNTFIVLSGIVFILGTAFQCDPISFFWDRDIQDGKCFNEKPWWISYSVIQISTDLLLLALPVKQVLHLKMSRNERLGLCLIFATGLL
jgi:hypothetical protein